MKIMPLAWAPSEGPGNVGDIPASLVYPLQFVAMGAVLLAGQLRNAVPLIDIASFVTLFLLASIAIYVQTKRLRSSLPLESARASWIQSALFVSMLIYNSL